MSSFRTLAALPLAAVVLAACSETTETPLVSAEDAPIKLATWQATNVAAECADGTFDVDDGDKLRGKIFIPSGCTFKVNHVDLDADGKVTIFGDASQLPSALIIEQGAKIDAQGTSTLPIVFTSSKAAGERAPGDWGGIVIIGKATANCGSSCNVEGLGSTDARTYGGTNDADNSGVMKYVRIEYAGFILDAASGNELNGLSLYSVGNGTQLSYIQAHRGSDDGIEFFGGTVDLKYAVVTRAHDDSYDFSYGWRGRGQYWIAQQDVVVSDKGIEADNDDAGSTNSPVTDPKICNITLVGRNDAATGTNWGIHSRRNTGGLIYNAVVIGFDSARASSSPESMVISHSVFYSSAGYNGLTASILTGNPRLANPFSGFDFRYQTGLPTSTASQSASCGHSSSDPWFENPSYRGAAPSTATLSQWYAGWTNTSYNS